LRRYCPAVGQELILEPDEHVCARLCHYQRLIVAGRTMAIDHQLELEVLLPQRGLVSPSASQSGSGL